MKAEDRITQQQGLKCRRLTESQQKLRARQKRMLLCSLRRDLDLQLPAAGAGTPSCLFFKPPITHHSIMRSLTKAETNEKQRWLHSSNIKKITKWFYAPTVLCPLLPKSSLHQLYELDSKTNPCDSGTGRGALGQGGTGRVSFNLGPSQLPPTLPSSSCFRIHECTGIPCQGNGHCQGNFLSVVWLSKWAVTTSLIRLNT